MKYSYRWLQHNVKEPLPPPEELRRVITTRAFEVEEVTTFDEDTIFDIKVLPDRAHDALSHRGMAREICALFGLTPVPRDVTVPVHKEAVQEVSVRVENPELCPRYIAVRVEGVTPIQTPQSVKTLLEAVGQRSINSIVDITNFVLFDIGQPMHAFDADKVMGEITIRLSKRGETMSTLDGKDLTLAGTELVIADEEGVLALAGIKGGKKAEVTSQTKNIILESANFHPNTTRRTSAFHRIKTDASKRFENGMTSTFAGEGMHLALALLSEVYEPLHRSEATDIYSRQEMWVYKIGVTVGEINRLLGTVMKERDVEAVLRRLGFVYQAVNPLSILELRIKETEGRGYKNPTSMREDAPSLFSCSSLVSYLYTHAGVWLPSISVDKYVYARPVKKEDLCFGDLVFANSGVGHIHYETVDFIPGTKVEGGIDHMGMYIGDGKIIHASSQLGGVKIEELSGSKQFRNVIGYRRVLEDIPEKRFVVEIPRDRLDLRIPADLIEEIGRHHGYNTISPTLPPLSQNGTLHKRLYYGNMVRAFLVERGFSEVLTSSFVGKKEGSIEVLNPVGDDRPYLRETGSPGMLRALALNHYYLQLLGVKDIKLFELGNMFPGKEGMTLTLGYAAGGKWWKSEKGLVKRILDDLHQALGGKGKMLVTSSYQEIAHEEREVIEIDFDALIAVLPEKHSDIESMFPRSALEKYHSPSPYPFVVRDIALFVPSSTEKETVAKVIETALGPLAVRFSLFDQFQKQGDDRISYAYRIVFQSFERTLTDTEVNGVMERVARVCADAGWQVR